MQWRCFRYEVVDSTSDRAFDALERGEGRHGDVFIADAQLSGRGTRGRRWSSDEGGLYMSAILETDSMPPPGLWTIAGALAAHDTAVRFGAPADLDWPNDLVSKEGAKIAGVLAESRGLNASSTAIFVLGIGINVMKPVSEEALDRQRATANLEELGEDVTLEAVELILLGALETRTMQAIESPEALYGDFFDRCVQSNRHVVVDVAETTVSGRLDALTADGSMRLFDPETGNHRSVSIAHVRSVKEAPAAS